MKTLTEKQFLEIKDIFQRVDKDNDGIITLEELEQVLKSTLKHLPDHKILQMVNEADTDSSGNISYQELYRMLKRKNKKNKLMKSFKLFDTNGDGLISLEELKEVLKQTGGILSDEQLANMIKDVDQDGDGNLSYKEFLNIMIQ